MSDLNMFCERIVLMIPDDCAAPPRSHGFGGDGVAMLILAKTVQCRSELLVVDDVVERTSVGGNRLRAAMAGCAAARDCESEMRCARVERLEAGRRACSVFVLKEVGGQRGTFKDQCLLASNDEDSQHISRPQDVACRDRQLPPMPRPRLICLNAEEPS